LSFASGHTNISWTQRLLATRGETNPSQALTLNFALILGVNSENVVKKMNIQG